MRECHCTVCHRHFSTVGGFDAHRRGMGRTDCHDPLALADPTGQPKYKRVPSAWGELYVGAKERPDLQAT
jgi:hypothetical protein